MASYDQLIAEVPIVKKYCPNIGNDEIFAHLEAHYHEKHRIQVVIGELMGLQVKFFEIPVEDLAKLNQHPLPLDPSKHDDLKSASNEPQPSTSGVNIENSIKNQVNTLTDMFPDADPEYIKNVITENVNNPNGIDDIVGDWLETKNYNKKLTEPKQNALKRKLVDRDFTVEEFLEMFPNPENYFNKTSDQQVSDNYKNHVMAYVNSTFPDTEVENTLANHQYHLIPVVKELQEMIKEPPKKRRKRQSPYSRKKNIKKPKKTITNIQFPDDVDELFFKELTYLELSVEIKEYQKKQEQALKRKFQRAKVLGTLMICECCFEDELLIDDLLPCENDHLYCKNCIRKQAEIRIGMNKLTFPCFNGYCQKEFSLSVLQKCLETNIFEILSRKKQEEEIRQAAIPDLESCPFCTYYAIMPDPNDKVFKCLNPECLKESCRLCKEPSHVPLRCDEVEKTPEVRMRTFLENKMTDAVLRVCPDCKRRFIKLDGCNKMTCQCGQTMCYVCRRLKVDYNHFYSLQQSQQPKDKCPLYCNEAKLHDQELKTMAKNAKKEYEKSHPEFKNVKLKHDPTKNIATK